MRDKLITLKTLIMKTKFNIWLEKVNKERKEYWDKRPWTKKV